MIKWLVAFYYCSTTHLVYTFFPLTVCSSAAFTLTGSLKLVLLHNQDFTLHFTNEKIILPKYIKRSLKSVIEIH